MENMTQYTDYELEEIYSYKLKEYKKLIKEGKMKGDFGNEWSEFSKKYLREVWLIEQ